MGNGEKYSDTKEVVDQLLASQKQVTRQAAEDGGNPYQLMDGLKDCCQSIWRLLKLEESRKTAIVLGIVWFCLSACWYGFMIWLPEFLQAKHDNSYLGNVVTSAGDLPGNLISFFLIEKIGRKKSLLISLVASAIF